MDIKLIKKIAPTVLKAALPCNPQKGPNEMPQVAMQLVAYDAHDISMVLGRIVLSPAEARELAQQLMKKADAAESI